MEESAFAAALGGGGEITGEAHAESPTKSGIRGGDCRDVKKVQMDRKIRGELQRLEKFR